MGPDDSNDLMIQKRVVGKWLLKRPSRSKVTAASHVIYARPWDYENGPVSYCPAGSATRRFALTRAEGSCMQTHEIGPLIAGLLSELVDGAAPGGDAFILNSGDAG